jgi:hypothetical protein
MKKQVILLCILAYLCQSCVLWELRRPAVRKLLRLSSSTEVEYCNQCQDFIYKDNNIYLWNRINDVEDTLMYDSGSTGDFTLIKFDTTGISNAGKIKIKSPEGKKEFYAYFEHCTIENNLLDGKNCVKEILYSTPLSLSCLSSSGVINQPIIGYNLLPGMNTQKIMCIDFSNRKICLYDSLSFDTNQYMVLKAAVKGRGIYIYATVNGIEHEFHFDTGCTGGLLMNKKDCRSEAKDDLLIEGTYSLSVNGITSSDTTIIRKETLYLTPFDSLVVENCYADNIDRNLMGIFVISQFDWIIDTKNKKVYVKPCNNTVDSTLTEEDNYPAHLVIPQDNRLIIAARNLSKNPIYPLHAVIKSVNGEEITPENICSYMKLLNNNDDWNQFQLEFFE